MGLSTGSQSWLHVRTTWEALKFPVSLPHLDVLWILFALLSPQGFQCAAWPQNQCSGSWLSVLLIPWSHLGPIPRGSDSLVWR